MKFLLIAILGTTWALGARAAKRADCQYIFSVEEVLKNAKEKDGMIICVKGVIVPVPDPDSYSATFHELVPGATQKSKPSPGKVKLGLLDWSPDLGISESYYKPDSFALLAAGEPTAFAVAKYRLSVTLRAAVMYKRNLRAQAALLIPPGGASEAIRETRYDVELVMLEILAVKRIGENNKRE